MSGSGEEDRPLRRGRGETVQVRSGYKRADGVWVWTHDSGLLQIGGRKKK